MKYLETIFDEMPARAHQRQAPAIRDRADIGLDEDLFLPVADPAMALQSRLAEITAPRARLTAAPLDLDERPWPTLELPPQPGPSALEKRIAEQERELAMRCTQVADLYNLQERQAADLQVAYAEIERLNAAFKELQDTATEHAMAAAERKKANTALSQENAVLRSKLDKATDDTAVLSKQMLTVESMFNDREMVITSALEQADLLKAELAASEDAKSRLMIAIEEADQLHRDDAKRKTATIDELSRKVESLFVDHGVQLKTRDKLAKRCDELAKANAALESAAEEVQTKLAAQGEHTAFLETVLRVERETADARIKELAVQLEHERMHRAAADQAASTMRHEMAALLKELSARRRPTGDVEPEAPAPQLDAA